MHGCLECVGDTDIAWALVHGCAKCVGGADTLPGGADTAPECSNGATQGWWECVAMAGAVAAPTAIADDPPGASGDRVIQGSSAAGIGRHLLGRKVETER